MNEKIENRKFEKDRAQYLLTEMKLVLLGQQRYFEEAIIRL